MNQRHPLRLSYIIGLVLGIVYPLIATPHCQTYESPIAGVISFPGISAHLNPLPYDKIRLAKDANQHHAIYFAQQNKGKSIRINLREKSFDPRCADSNFINIETFFETETPAFYRATFKTMSTILLLDDPFKITATVSDDAELLSYSLSHLKPKATAQIGTPDQQCHYAVFTNKNQTPPIGSISFYNCPVVITLYTEPKVYFYSDLSHKEIKDTTIRIPMIDTYIESTLHNADNQLIGYFRFYLNGKFDILDLNKQPL